MLIVKTRNWKEMLMMLWEEVCYEILVYISQLSQTKTCFAEFNFLKKDIYVNKGTLQIFDIFLLSLTT